VRIRRGVGLATSAGALVLGSVLAASVAEAAAPSSGPSVAVTPTAAASPSVSSAGSAPKESRVALSLVGSPSEAPNATVTVLAKLYPGQAFGSVTLWDGTRMVASGDNFRWQWSYTTSSMAPGMHHMTVVFEPAAGSGFLPSKASLDRLVVDPVLAARPTPTAHKSRDPQPIVVTIPSVKATTTVRPTRSVRPSTGPGRSVRPTRAGRGGRTGPLAMTGVDAYALIVLAVALLAAGGVLSSVRRRKLSTAGRRH
jgi:hypothetical protein